MSNVLCLSERSTRTISIYAYGIVGGFMGERDRAIVCAMCHYVAAIVYAVYYRVWGEASTMRHEVNQRRHEMMSRTVPSGLAETNSLAQPQITVATVEPIAHKVWVEAVLAYCGQHGTEAYIESLGFNTGKRLTLNDKGESVPVVFYRKTMRGKSVRYVECDRLCGEVLYVKKGKRYTKVGG